MKAKFRAFIAGEWNPLRNQPFNRIAALLDEAEAIVNAAGPEILAEVDKERNRKTGLLPKLSKKARAKMRKNKKKR